MSSVIADPVVLICSGVLIVGVLSMVWAIATLLRPPKPETSGLAPIDDLPSPLSDVRGLDFGAPPVRSAPVPASVSAVVSSPAVSKEVADRLDSMSQRLAEMQGVLTRQGSGASSDPLGHGGAVGQGFSPETIDKLLKIIGNVVQQVDILQKNLNPSKEASVPRADNPSAPAAKP